MADDKFSEHKLMILGELSRLSKTMIKLQDIVADLTIKVGQLEIADKIRASIWGGMAGFITATILVALAILLERLWS